VEESLAPDRVGGQAVAEPPQEIAHRPDHHPIPGAIFGKVSAIDHDVEVAPNVSIRCHLIEPGPQDPAEVVLEVALKKDRVNHQPWSPGSG